MCKYGAGCQEDLHRLCWPGRSQCLYSLQTHGPWRTVRRPIGIGEVVRRILVGRFWASLGMKSRKWQAPPNSAPVRKLAVRLECIQWGQSSETPAWKLFYLLMCPILSICSTDKLLFKTSTLCPLAIPLTNTYRSDSSLFIEGEMLFSSRYSLPPSFVTKTSRKGSLSSFSSSTSNCIYLGMLLGDVPVK